MGRASGAALRERVRVGCSTRGPHALVAAARAQHLLLVVQTRAGLGPGQPRLADGGVAQLHHNLREGGLDVGMLGGGKRWGGGLLPSPPARSHLARGLLGAAGELPAHIEQAVDGRVQRGRVPDAALLQPDAGPAQRIGQQAQRARRGHGRRRLRGHRRRGALRRREGWGGRAGGTSAPGPARSAGASRSSAPWGRAPASCAPAALARPGKWGATLPRGSHSG